ncbi:UNVERIFIED_CONTAM: hypothetical protein Slati_0499300 [Sesamum latifolium]|uniref:RNase H type-1 domain-containing protein n=1 Tax=Sesamum latifolium TaxID=2727402 RepID=A0AAW2XY13_9LAMI
MELSLPNPLGMKFVASNQYNIFIDPFGPSCLFPIFRSLLGGSSTTGYLLRRNSNKRGSHWSPNAVVVKLKKSFHIYFFTTSTLWKLGATLLLNSRLIFLKLMISSSLSSPGKPDSEQNRMRHPQRPSWESDLCFSRAFGNTTNTQAELRAIHRGLQICIDKGLHNIWIETDATAIIKLISTPRQGEWNLQTTLQIIRKFLSQMDYKISHVFREGNQAANFLANQACNAQQLHILPEDALPGKVKAHDRFYSVLLLLFYCFCSVVVVLLFCCCWQCWLLSGNATAVPPGSAGLEQLVVAYLSRKAAATASVSTSISTTLQLQVWWLLSSMDLVIYLELSCSYFLVSLLGAVSHFCA